MGARKKTSNIKILWIKKHGQAHTTEQVVSDLQQLVRKHRHPSAYFTEFDKQ
jgi:hypothetical protein